MFLLSVIDSLSNLSVRIPEFIQRGETADLTCSFNLGGDKLYSVKWYKGRHEFYRYMPDQDPVVKAFPVKGMHINVSIEMKGLAYPIFAELFTLFSKGGGWRRQNSNFKFRPRSFYPRKKRE